MAKFIKVYYDGDQRKSSTIINVDLVERITLMGNGKVRFYYRLGEEVNAIMNETELQILKNKLEVPL